MRYRLQRHDGTDCSATMVPITVLRMVPIQRYRHTIRKSLYYSVFWQIFSPNNLHRCAPEPELVRMSEDIRERDDAIAEVVPTF